MYICTLALLVGAVSCESEPDPYATASQESDSYYYGFSWVRSGALAGMPYPGRGDTLENRLAYLEQEGVEVLFSLTESSTPAEVAADYGISLIHIPVRDFTAPSQAQLLYFLDEAQAAMDADLAVGVHCFGGRGRTGTFLAAWFVHEGMTGAEALAEVRRLRPGSVETKTQEQAIYELALTLSGEQP